MTNKTQTIHIWTTANYPYYNHTTETVAEEKALDRFDEISKELIRKCNAGELQDYKLELRNR